MDDDATEGVIIGDDVVLSLSCSNHARALESNDAVFDINGDSNVVVAAPLLFATYSLDNDGTTPAPAVIVVDGNGNGCRLFNDGKNANPSHTAHNIFVCPTTLAARMKRICRQTGML